MKMNIGAENFISDLKNNAIFQLSLSSKELFHSNFLAWLAEDDNTRGVFNQIMRSWMENPDWTFDPETMVVKREYNHFDLCVCDRHIDKEKEVIDGVQLVLENKFKSIAYKAQLKNYMEKAETKNKNNANTKYILLTLAEDFVDKTVIECLGWEIITYAEYAKLLREGINLINDCFYRELIGHYCKFIETFAEHTKKCLNNIRDDAGWGVLDDKDFKEVRCNDIWQKLVMHKYAQKLKYLVKVKFHNTPIVYDDKDCWTKSEKNPLIIRVAYHHSQALLELKYLLDNGVIFCAQQQGNNHLSIGMVVDKDHTINKSLRKEKNKTEWHNQIKKRIESKKLSDIIPGDKFKSFQAEGGCGFYYITNNEELNIKATLEKMVELMGEAIKTTRK